MHLLLLKEDDQVTAADALDALHVRGYQAAFPTAGASVEQTHLVELAAAILGDIAENRVVDQEAGDSQADPDLACIVDEIDDWLDRNRDEQENG